MTGDHRTPDRRTPCRSSVLPPQAETMPTFKAPKGTRDFYPEDMAVRRHIEAAWRSASIRHGFEEIEGPTFEQLGLYTVKSGDGIVSELFSFRRSGGTDDYALRPEFTPTLARMVAARGGSLPRPVKWFAIPSHFRAERPQRGRLREFFQWNVDMLGLDDPSADAEVLSTGLTALDALGIRPDVATVRLSHRDAVASALEALGVDRESMHAAFQLLDRRDKLPPEDFAKKAGALGLDATGLAALDRLARIRRPVMVDLAEIAAETGVPVAAFEPMIALRESLQDAGVSDWCEWDLGIVRGLAYYTGTVFEVHETGGGERAIAGGGRYDGLVELMGGPPTSGVGFGMGDVVLGLVLRDRGLLEGIKPPRPSVFVLVADDEAERPAVRILASLRQAGVHARRSYRATRNVGKLMSEASRAGAGHAVIVGRELEDGVVVVKDLRGGGQETVPVDALVRMFSGGDGE
ncbi:MAG: histidine--tRNA ligase [Phycisphaerae bacterium]|nr:histidine--tRNA ligase [Phycisphaerae bacterium]